jgi:HlyD family secretion protein
MAARAAIRAAEIKGSEMKLPRRRILLIVGGIAGIGVAAAIALASAGAAATPATQGEASYREAKIVKGDLRETVSATGPVKAHRRSDMSFLLSSPVGQINVEAGQRTHVGNVLMTLDTSQYELDLADAQLALQAQQIAFNELVQGPNKYDVAAARGAIARSAAQLAQLKAPPNEDTIRLAQQGLELQRDSLYKAQTARDGIAFLVQHPRINRTGISQLELDHANLDVASAELAVRIAEQQLIDAQQGVSSHDIGGAQASLAQSLSTLNRLLEGPTDTQLALANSQIQQSALAVESAKSTLKNAVLDAPFDGVVGEVNYVPGEQAVPGQIALVLLDDSSFHVDVLIDEVDIAQLKEGQLAFVRLDAYPDQQLSAHVVRVAPDAVNSNGVVSYLVRVNLDSPGVAVHDGMTATVDIVVSELTNVLLVPNWAVRFDRQSGQAFVNVQRPDNSIQEVMIGLGQRGASASEVRSGLAEGDTVVVSLSRQPFTFEATQTGN